jgi:hypothetical protein
MQDTIQSRCRGISLVRLHLTDCAGRAWSQRDLARSVG